MGYTKPETQRRWREKNPSRYAVYKERANKKYAEDPVFRENKKARGNTAKRLKYATDPTVKEKENLRRQTYRERAAPEIVAENYLTETVKSMGGLSPKFIDPSRRGAPDRMVLLPGHPVYFVEMKREIFGALKTHQIRYHNDLRRLGHRVWVLWSKAEVDEFISEVTLT